jgi:hypothetical protein
MHRSRHPYMNQAYQLKVPRDWERDRIGLAVRQGARVNAGASGDIRSVRCRPRTTHRERRSNLARLQETHSVDLGGVKAKSNAVSGMNPKFIRQKGQSLVCFVTALRTHAGMPDCGLNWLSSDQKGKRPCATEGSRRKADSSQKARYGFLLTGNPAAVTNPTFSRSSRTFDGRGIILMF